MPAVLFCLLAGSGDYNSGAAVKESYSINANNPSDNGGIFIIGALNSAYYNDLSTMTGLGFNLWHKYTGYYQDAQYRRTAPRWSETDNLTSSTDNNKAELTSQLDNASSHNLQALLMRPKIEYLSFGQRSDYQCEVIKKADDTQWFYSFRDNERGTDIPDSGAMVRYCKVNPSISPEENAGWIVKGVKANTEQSNPGDNHGDKKCTWYIKPKIRINPAADENTRVCRVVVVNHKGDSIMKTDILAKDFKIKNKYIGEYREEYNLTGGRTLNVKSNWGNDFNFAARGDFDEKLLGNHADVQIYWYGECDMWIDYVRVDDDIANELFKGKHDNWLEEEAKYAAAFNNGAGAYRFYIEIFEYNNIPCMAYVSRKLDSISFANWGKHISLLSIPIPPLFTAHLPRSDRHKVENLTHFKKFFIDKIGSQDFMLSSYPFSSSYIEGETYTKDNTWSRIPNTLPVSEGKGMLAPAVSPEEYDKWLQEYLDYKPYFFEKENTTTAFDGEYEPGLFRYTMEKGDAVSKLTGLPFIFNAQGHMWKYKNQGSQLKNGRWEPGEVQREPTDEELDLTANLAISYGARGIIYFQYNTLYNNPYGSERYDRGIADYNNTPRILNIYGQKKWEKIREIVSRVKKWGPYIMNFDNANRRSFIYRTETQLMQRDSYVDDLVSSVNGSDENISKRYLQLSVFKDDAGVNYFMVVNRRCSPLSDGKEDGSRNVRILFDMNDAAFSNAKSWRIIDLYTNGFVSELDKKNIGNIDLGLFQPGEGKLYKLEKVN